MKKKTKRTHRPSKRMKNVIKLNEIILLTRRQFIIHILNTYVERTQQVMFINI